MFGGSNPPNTWNYTSAQGFLQVFYTCCSTSPNLSWNTPQHKQTLGEGVLHVFGVVRTLRTSTPNYTTCSVWFNLSKETLGEGVLYVFGVVRNPPNFYELHLSIRKLLVRVFYTCSVWFDPSEPLGNTPQHKQTLGEGILHMFGVFEPSEPLRTHLSTRKLLVRVFFTRVRCGFEPLRTSSNYTNGQANTWRGCSTCVRCGSTPMNLLELQYREEHTSRRFSTGVRCCSTSPNLLEIHLSTSKHLVRVFYTCSVWFEPPNLYELHLSTRKLLVRVFYTCSVVRSSEPLGTTPQHKETLGEGVLYVFGVVRTLRTSTNYTSALGNSW